MRQCAKVYFQLKNEIQNGQNKVQQGIERSDSRIKGEDRKRLAA